jgi:C-terminal processing protease CtpA/Prc
VSYLSADKGGALADSGTIGLVGGEVLNRFTLTFDFPAGKLYLEKGKRFAESFIGPRTGFSGALESDGTYSIKTVLAGSPASEAGLVVGDLLLSIDGKPVRALGVHGIREALRRAPGTSVVLGIQSASGSSKEQTIVLKELL